MYLFSQMNKLKKFAVNIIMELKRQNKCTKTKTIKNMYYIPPKNKDGKEIWCPIVIKDRATLLSCINTLHYTKQNIESALQQIDVKIDVPMTLPFDSSRFNDIMTNGKRERYMTEKDFQQEVQRAVQKQMDYYAPNSGHGENMPFNKDVYFFSIECPMCKIPWNWTSCYDIPKDDFYCPNCEDQILIQYTGVEDEKFTFDG